MKKDMNQKNTITLLRVLYVVWVLVGMFSIMYVPSTLINFDDPISTATQINENTLLFRLGIAGRLITQLLFIIIPFLLYTLLKTLNHTAARLLLILALVSIPISMQAEALQLGIFQNLDTPNLVMESLELYNQTLYIATIFWGLWLLPLGWIIYNYRIYPKFIGISLYAAGLGYVCNSFIKIINPAFDQLSVVLEIMTFGEVIFVIWLVAFGFKKLSNTSIS